MPMSISIAAWCGLVAVERIHAGSGITSQGRKLANYGSLDQMMQESRQG